MRWDQRFDQQVVVPLGVLLLAVVIACPSPGPGPQPPPPDADGAPPSPPKPISDSAPTTDCQLACAVLATVCGPQLATCPTRLEAQTAAKLERKPEGGALTCADIAHVTSKAQLAALGQSCP